MNKQDAFDLFGQYVAAELRELPAREAILLQQQIQNSIISAKLSCLQPSSTSLSRSPPSTYAHSITYATPQPSPDPEFINMTTNPSNTNTVPNDSASELSPNIQYVNVMTSNLLPNSCWSNNTTDVLQKVMQDTFDNTDNTTYMAM